MSCAPRRAPSDRQPPRARSRRRLRSRPHEACRRAPIRPCPTGGRRCAYRASSAKGAARSCWFRSGSRYSVTTLAPEKSSLKMSPWMIVTLSATPARSALAPRERGEIRVVLDADRLRAEFLRRRDRYPAVSGAEIVDDVVARGLRRLQHPGDHRVGRGQPHHVLAGLAQPRPVELVAELREFLREREIRQRQRAEQGEQRALRAEAGPHAALDAERHDRHAEEHAVERHDGERDRVPPTTAMTSCLSIGSNDLTAPRAIAEPRSTIA